jgi:hypothetical protein
MVLIQLAAYGEAFSETGLLLLGVLENRSGPICKWFIVPLTGIDVSDIPHRR